jgi:hypothetical protein
MVRRFFVIILVLFGFALGSFRLKPEATRDLSFRLKPEATGDLSFRLKAEARSVGNLRQTGFGLFLTRGDAGLSVFV